jgi:predicted transcriptional regulator
MVGNIPNFTDIDILRCLLNINKDTSRLDLVKKLELGEGTIRTILNILKNNKLITSTQKGHSLSEKGIKILNNIKKDIEVLNKIKYREYKNLKNQAIVVKNLSKIEKITQLRDTAIKNGAEAALILLFDKKLKMPDFECQEDFSELEEYYNFKNKDILVATFASSQKLAEQSAFSIVFELNKDLKKFIKSLNK